MRMWSAGDKSNFFQENFVTYETFFSGKLCKLWVKIMSLIYPGQALCYCYIATFEIIAFWDFQECQVKFEFLVIHP